MKRYEKTKIRRIQQAQLKEKQAQLQNINAAFRAKVCTVLENRADRLERLERESPEIAAEEVARVEVTKLSQRRNARLRELSQRKSREAYEAKKQARTRATKKRAGLLAKGLETCT